MNDIAGREAKFKTLLMRKLSPDKRLNVTCPDFKYPAPLFVYVKSVKTEKTIAVRLDGVDKTVRFWDYVDDDYSEEDGVWDEMSDEGLDRFVKKLYDVMEKAVDVEFYAADGECEDYWSGVESGEITAAAAQKTVKKHGKGIDFLLAKYSNFFGDKQYVFNRAFAEVKR